jgi:acetoacetate decarboxylase
VLQLFAHALGNVAKLPVLDLSSGTHFVAGVTVGLVKSCMIIYRGIKKRRFRTLLSRRSPRNE